MGKKLLNLRLRIRILILITLSTLLLSCEDDDYIKQISNNEAINFKVENIYKPNFNNDEKLRTTVEMFTRSESNNNLQMRGIYIPEYDFTVNDDVVKHIVYGNYESYTFSIIKDNPTKEVENLLLSKQIDGSYKASIVSYDLTEQEKQDIKNGQEVNLAGKVDYEALETQAMSLGSGGCIEIIETHIPPGSDDSFSFPLGQNTHNCQHNSTGDYCKIVLSFNTVDCPEQPIDDSFGGGGTITDNDNNPDDTNTTNNDNPFGDLLGGGTKPNDNSNQNNDSNNNNDDTNDPNDNSEQEVNDCLQVDTNGNCVENLTGALILDEEEEEDGNDCERLKEITDVPDIRNKLKQMKPSSDNSNGEKGLRIYDHPSLGITASNILNENNSSNHISIPITSMFTMAIAHNHPMNNQSAVYTEYEMYAGPDIMKLGEILRVIDLDQQDTVDPLDVTHFLVTKSSSNNDRTFALRFDDLISIQKFMDVFNNIKKREKFIRTLQNKYKSDVGDPPLYESTTTRSKQQKHIYDLLANYDINMSMYEANYDASGYVNDWQKINKTTLNKENCN